ncbi:MAG: 2-succinyl-6-hydroxy-2,4-cyclohexadiene-1-carboxylate synthase [Chloroflexota bacterium]
MPTINGLHYHTERQGEGELLVLLHGFTGSTANWQPHTDVFARHYRVLTIDLPGHGKTNAPTDPARYAMETVAQDIAAIIGEHGGSANLLGYSMGGRLALYMAVHHADVLHAVVLESTSPGLRTPAERTDRQRRDDALADRIERDGIPAFVASWEALPLWGSQQHLSDDVQQKLRQQRLQNNSVGLANSLRGMGTGVQPSLWGELNTLTLPTLLITGELDTKFMAIADEMQQHIPYAQHTVIQSAGHTTHLEQPEQFQQTVLTFIQPPL